MAKATQIPESSMEEILASIRKIISEDESKSPPLGAPSLRRDTPIAAPDVISAGEPSNVARLFRPDTDRTEEERNPVRDEPSPDHAAADRMARSDTGDDDRPVSMTPASMSNDRDSVPPEPEASSGSAVGPLLSRQADVAVAAAFNHLAGTILSSNSRTIEQMAEDMMRPMLKAWLDDNLPPLVERLVREEIERVSRRR